MIKVAFDYTLDELVEVTLRSQRKTKTYQRGVQRAILLAGVATFVLVYLLIRDEFWVRIAIGVVGALVSMGLNLWLVRKVGARRLKKYYRELIPDQWPIHLEIELNENGVVASERDSTTELQWSRIAKVEEANRAVEFTTREGKLFVLRARAFQSEEEKQQFIHFAKQHIQPSTQESK